MNISAKRIIGSSEIFWKKNGPTILTAAGVGGFVATNVLVIRATLKSREKAKALAFSSKVIEDKELTDTYQAKDRGREMASLWVREGIPILADFAPAIVVASVSIFCVIAGNGMLRHQKAAIAAAYTVLDSGFRSYRARVREEVGEEKELELYRKPDVVVLQDRESEGFDPNLPCLGIGARNASPYARFFDETSAYWKKTPEYNLFFLRQQENWANERLRAEGFVFLNEVYHDLGLERNQAGQAVGWRLDAAEKGTGDGFISFGLEDIFDESSRAFINGLEATVLLDFNVDGEILI